MHTVNITSDQSALLAFKTQISDPLDILANNWSVHTPVCDWIGVSCGSRHNRVVSLNIRGMSLGGQIPPQLGNLSFLVSLDLSFNNFSGQIPSELVHLRRLRYLKLSVNYLREKLPPWLGLLGRLRHLSIANNSFSGTFPPVIFSNLSMLDTLLVQNNFLQGRIPQARGNLSQLNILDMQNNTFTGPVPHTLFNISSLEVIGLTWNRLSGDLPSKICNHLPNLQKLGLSSNQFSGEIPHSFFGCHELQMLSLSINKFTGVVPNDIGNLTQLKELYLGFNNLIGALPAEIGKLQNLQILSVENNSLSGSIPVGLFNISTLIELELAFNHFSGPLPWNLGSGLPNLEGIRLYKNNLQGTIPESISNCSKLMTLGFASNSFTGTIPNSLGRLGLLEILNLGENNLKYSTSKLTFITSLANCRNLRVLVVADNPLNSELPPSVGNLSTTLEEIFMSNCKLIGKVPIGIVNLSSLIRLDLSENEFTGHIPRAIRGLHKVQRLDLGENKFTGTIPPGLCHLFYLELLRIHGNQISNGVPDCLGNITSLRLLDLGGNRFNSSFPLGLCQLTWLLQLDLSSNLFTGPLPPHIAKLTVATLIDLSTNNFSGAIPSTIESLQSLTYLNISNNRLEGSIPGSLGGSVSLEVLDLSNNDLSGEIPKSLEKLEYLADFNVSFNRLRGEIPSNGPFRNFTYMSFVSNEALCSINPGFHVPPCPISSSHRLKVPFFVYIVLAIALVTFGLVCLFLYIRTRRRKLLVGADTADPLAPAKISYYQLREATNGFDSSNLIGVGSFGSVYKGILRDGIAVAVKVFNLQPEGAFRSFDTECEVLRNLRHRNLTKVISSCSNLDFKALILEFMPNWSLEKWLYSHNYFLNMMQRLNIMIDVASALEYLHHDYVTPVVHCDVKPGNILLDEDMVAHVSDFGISKLLFGEETIAHTKTLATIGYIAPEYGSEGLVSIRCDVYSYGIMLLETFTRKRPSDDEFTGDLDLRRWVNDKLSASVSQVIDGNLFASDDRNYNEKLLCALALMELGLHCCSDSPVDRMNMKDVRIELERIKSKAIPCFT